MKKVIISVAFFWGGLVYAQISLHPTIKKGIDEAIIKSKELQISELKNEKEFLKKQGVANRYLPKLDFTGMYGYSAGNVTVDVPVQQFNFPIGGSSLFEGEANFEASTQVYSASLMAKSVIFSGLQIPNAKKALTKKIEGNNFLIEAQKEEIAKEVITSFDQLYILVKAKKLIESSEKRLEKERLRVEKSIKLGLAIPYDRDKIKLAQLELASKKVEITGNNEVLVAKINYLTGLPQKAILLAVDELTPFYILHEKLNLAGRKDLKALEAFKDAQDFFIKKEKGSYLPQAGIFIGLTYSGLFDSELKTPSLPIINQSLNLELSNMALEPFLMTGVGLKWTIFDGLERKHKVEEAEINKQVITNKLIGTKEKLELLLKNNLAKYSTQKSKLNLAYQQEKIAKNNLHIAEKQYKLGLISVTERLASENEIVKAQLNIAKSIVNQRLSAIEVLLTSGVLIENIKVNK